MKLFDLSVSRTIDASADAIFDAWIDPAKFSAWMLGARVIMNPVVDGLYYLAVDHAGRTWAHYGRFLRLERPRVIQQTWMSEPTQGLESVVTVLIEPRGERTELTIRHTGLPDDVAGRQHEQGWTSLLEMIGKTLGRPL